MLDQVALHQSRGDTRILKRKEQNKELVKSDEIIVSKREHIRMLVALEEKKSDSEMLDKKMGAQQGGFWIPELAQKELVAHTQGGSTPESITMLDNMEGALAMCSQRTQTQEKDGDNMMLDNLSSREHGNREIKQEGK
jgi:hypothetical protein